MRHGYCGSYGWPSGSRLSPAAGQIKGPAHDLIHAERLQGDADDHGAS